MLHHVWPKGIWIYRFPGFQLTASNQVFKAEMIEPVSPNRLKSSNWFWYKDTGRRQVSEAFDWSRQVVEEDLRACEKVQRNLETGVYQDGPLSPMQEIHVATLQALVRKALAG